MSAATAKIYQSHRAATCAANFTTHGFRRAGGLNGRTYKIWSNVKARCLTVTNHAYADYGGRGISIPDKWHAFEGFLEDMGICPDGLSIGRIDNDAGYSKENCRWETSKEQANNRRSNVFVTAYGQRKTLQQWADSFDLTVSGLRYRLNTGWSVERALSQKCRMSDDGKRQLRIKRNSAHETGKS